MCPCWMVVFLFPCRRDLNKPAEWRFRIVMTKFRNDKLNGVIDSIRCDRGGRWYQQNLPRCRNVIMIFTWRINPWSWFRLGLLPVSMNVVEFFRNYWVLWKESNELRVADQVRPDIPSKEGCWMKRSVIRNHQKSMRLSTKGKNNVNDLKVG